MRRAQPHEMQATRHSCAIPHSIARRYSSGRRVAFPARWPPSSLTHSSFLLEPEPGLFARPSSTYEYSRHPAHSDRPLQRISPIPPAPRILNIARRRTQRIALPTSPPTTNSSPRFPRPANSLTTTPCLPQPPSPTAPSPPPNPTLRAQVPNSKTRPSATTSPTTAAAQTPPHLLIIRPRSNNSSRACINSKRNSCAANSTRGRRGR